MYLIIKMSNITYVSFLFGCDDDRITVEKRLEWLEPLVKLNINLVLFVDSVYAPLVKASPSLKIVKINQEDLATIRIIRENTLRLPPQRNAEKDTLNFLSYMNCKPELLVIAMQYVSTPYVAYIDAGISKVFKEPGTLSKLETLSVKNIPLILLPGCHPIKEVEPFPHLWKGIHWMLSGGFFVVPVTCVNEWYTLHINALKKFINMGTITWEVNVWASFAHTVSNRIVWYNGPHTDAMINDIPKDCLLQPI